MGFCARLAEGIPMSICNSILLLFQLDEQSQATVLIINNKTKPSNSSQQTVRYYHTCTKPWTLAAMLTHII
jgi:hypothetical protein